MTDRLQGDSVGTEHPRTTGNPASSPNDQVSSSLSQELASLRQQLEAAKQEVVSTHHRMVGLLLRAEKAEAELALLKEENQRLRKEIDTHVAVVLKCNADLESSDARLSQLKEERDALRNEIDEALATAEGPSTLRGLVAWFHHRGAELIDRDESITALLGNMSLVRAHLGLTPEDCAGKSFAEFVIAEIEAAWSRAESSDARLLQMREALLKLSNEVRGLLGFAEEGLREVVGNTNIAALQNRVKAAEEALTGQAEV